jgi:hypothetical protein
MLKKPSQIILRQTLYTLLSPLKNRIAKVEEHMKHIYDKKIKRT